MKHVITFATLAALSTGCPTPGPPDGGACDLEVEIGAALDGGFAPLADGAPGELVLGFQGFRMLPFALLVHGIDAPRELEVGASLEVPDTGATLDQRTRERALAPASGGVLLAEYLVFVNDLPDAQFVGHRADMEVIVRVGSCVGGARARVEIRDDDPCISHGIVLDAATRPDAPDGGVVCPE